MSSASVPLASALPTRDEELQRRLDGLNRLLHVTRALAVEIDPDRILKLIITDACQALDCDRASLYQYDAKRNELFTAVVTELEIEEIRKSVEFGVSGYVARERVIANVPDPPLDPRWNGAVDRATGYQTRNILAAPLTSPHDGGLLGVLEVLNKNAGSFDKIDEALIEAFGQHAAAALDRARLVEQLKQREQTEASLNVAREVQRRFMPAKMPAMAGYEFATWWYPHEAVGGDYCDLLSLRDGRTALCVADVSGHGLGPSLIMASVRAALRTLLLEHNSPDELLSMLASALADDLSNLFITMILVTLDPAAHRFEFANAGHGPAVHYSAANGKFTHLDATGMPLGVIPNAAYPLGAPRQLAPGDMVLLCTDGIVEAMDEDGKQFGQERLERLVNAFAREPLADLAKRIGAAVSAHYEGESPPDDLTILIARRNI